MGITNDIEVKREGMTFSDYFNGIPKYDRKSFVIKIMDLCEVGEATVYNWATNKFKPQKPSYYKILSEITGIAPENLFAE